MPSHELWGEKQRPRDYQDHVIRKNTWLTRPRDCAETKRAQTRPVVMGPRRTTTSTRPSVHAVPTSPMPSIAALPSRFRYPRVLFS